MEYGFEDASGTGPDLRDNLLQINVYFQSLNVKKITEEPKYVVCYLQFVLHVNSKKFI